MTDRKGRGNSRFPAGTTDRKAKAMERGNGGFWKGIGCFGVAVAGTLAPGLDLNS